MRLDSKAEEAYTDLWLPLREDAGTQAAGAAFLARPGQDDPKARQSTIYSDQVQRLEKLRDEHELVERSHGSGASVTCSPSSLTRSVSRTRMCVRGSPG